MCAACSASGTEKQCPTCRSLNPIGFPYDANADLGTLWGHVTTVFQRELALCVVAGLIFFAFSMGGGLVANIINTVVTKILGIKFDPANPLSNLPGFGVNMVISQVVGTVVNIAVQGIALVGLYRFYLDVLVGKKADLARMFSQLHLLPQYLVMHLIIFFFVTVPMLVGLAIVGVVGLRMIDLDFNRISSFRVESLFRPELLALLFGSLVVFMIAMVVVLPVTLFATPELIVGQCGAVEALKRAWDLGDGQRLRVFGYSFVAGVVTFAGVLACFVGIVFALPVAYMLLLALFLALRQSSQLPPALHT